MTPCQESGQELQQRVRDALVAVGDPVRARDGQRYLKSAMPLAGVPMPEVRRIARLLGRQAPIGGRRGFEATLRRMWDQACVREERYAVIEISGLRCYAAWQDPDLLRLYRHLVVSGAWWDLVDTLAVHRVGPIRRGFPGAVDPVLRAWADGDDLWLRRTAVLSQVGAKDDLDSGLLAEVLEPNLDRREYFLRKAVGWALRDASGRHPEWVRAYVADNRARLSALSVKEATRRLPASTR